MNRLRKTTATLLIAISMMILVIPVMAKPPTSLITYTQTQFQWRATKVFGTWSKASMVDESAYTESRLTEDALHCWIEYSPLVDPFGKTRGMSHVYIHDGTGHWTMHEGKTSYMYTPIYGPYRVVNYFRGYMEFDGAPSTENFVHGVLYQWAYVMKPHKEPVQDEIPYAEWDPVMNAWLVGFSVYIQDPQKPTTPHTLTFPGPLTAFPRPVPANNDNHLGL